MSAVRPPAVAGLFYPDRPQELRSQLETLLNAADAPAPAGRIVALIAPHAGYVYSGPIAASVYASLPKHRFRRVVLIGPSHRVALRGLALGRWRSFRTPLGDIPVCQESVRTLLQLEQVVVNDRAHAREHSLEVHLPFLQSMLGEFELVPLVTGQATAAEVAGVLDALAPDESTLIVVSSDLSHYLDYDAARALDRRTSQTILELDPAGLERDQACGRHSIRGLLEYAKREGLRPTLLDLRNSGDTAGDRARVVGYGAYRFEKIPA